MIGICPHCRIKLNEPPFANRETNEVMLVLNYRKIIELKLTLAPIEELGHCELCRATKEDLEKQKSLISLSLKKK